MSTSCLQSSCLPNSVKRERYYDLSGKLKEIDVIESCECFNYTKQSCQRYPSRVKIHVDTPYEREVDVGQCLGSCDDNSSENCLFCLPVRNRSMSLEGPNGAQCLTVVDECKCVGECYRVKQFLQVYDYTNVFVAKFKAMNTVANSTTASTVIGNVNGSVSTLPEIAMARVIDNSSLESLGPLTKV